MNTLDCLKESIEKLPGKRGQRHIIITGDANVHVDWNTKQPQENSATKPLDKKIINITDEYNLKQMVTFPTRMDNTLDLFMTSDPSKIINVRPAPPISDHDVVIVDMDLCVKKKPRTQHVVYNWKKANFEDLNKNVSEKISSMNFNDDNIENNWVTFKNILIEARDQHVPHRLSTSRHNLPWYNQRLRKLGNKKQRLYNKSKNLNLGQTLKPLRTAEQTSIEL